MYKIWTKKNWKKSNLSFKIKVWQVLNLWNYFFMIITTGFLKSKTVTLFKKMRYRVKKIVKSLNKKNVTIVLQLVLSLTQWILIYRFSQILSMIPWKEAYVSKSRSDTYLQTTRPLWQNYLPTSQFTFSYFKSFWKNTFVN